ncbi:MAG: hypothetical protein WC934_06835 [Acidithiobacillus sp.]|jgi:hypothetical protein|uniref:hypothetical protein n=1 Tax=Acidithiobacillus sp. TaxID=1872118 RepID=UPI00355D181B
MIKSSKYAIFLCYISFSLSFMGYSIQLAKAIPITITDTSNDIFKTDEISLSPTIYSTKVSAPYLDIQSVIFDRSGVNPSYTFSIELILNQNMETVDTSKQLYYHIVAGKEGLEEDSMMILCDIEFELYYGRWFFTSYNGQSGTMDLDITENSMILTSLSTTGFYIGGDYDEITQCLVYAVEVLDVDLYNIDFYYSDFYVWDPTYDLSYMSPFDASIDIKQTYVPLHEDILISNEYAITNKSYLDLSRIEVYSSSYSTTYNYIVKLNFFSSILNQLTFDTSNNTLHYIILLYSNSHIILNITMDYDNETSAWIGCYTIDDISTVITDITIGINYMIFRSNVNWYDGVYTIEDITDYYTFCYQKYDIPIDGGQYFIDVMPNILISENGERHDVLLTNNVSNTPLYYQNVSTQTLTDIHYIKFEEFHDISYVYSDKVYIYVEGGLNSINSSIYLCYNVTLKQYNSLQTHVIDFCVITVIYNGTWNAILFEDLFEILYESTLNVTVEILNDYTIKLIVGGHILSEYYPYSIEAFAYQPIDNYFYLDAYPNSIFHPIFSEFPTQQESDEDISYLWYYIGGIIIMLSFGIIIGIYWYNNSCNNPKKMFSQECMQKRDILLQKIEEKKNKSDKKIKSQILIQQPK